MIALTQVETDVGKKAHGGDSSRIQGLAGSKAIAGAIARMSQHSNRLGNLSHNISSAVFGDWDDWDNGHSDG